MILYRTARYYGYNVDSEQSADLSAFKDEASISAYALDGMRWAVGSGLLIGDDSLRLNPKGAATRAESVTILSRFFTKYE